MLQAVIMGLALQATLTPDDVPSIVQAVVEATLPGAENVVVAEESGEAFRPLLPPDATVSLAGTDAPILVLTERDGAWEVVDVLILVP